MQKISFRKQSRLLFIIFMILYSYFPAFAQEEKGRAYYDFGVFAYEDGDYEGAEKNLKKAVEMNPKQPFYNHYLGKTLIKTEQYPEALKYLNAALELAPDLSEVKYDLGFLNYRMSEYAKAAALLKDVVAAKPSDVLANYYTGISLYKLKNYKDAPDYLLRAAEKSPTLRANAYYHVGICYQKIGENEKSLESFTLARQHADSEELKENAERWIQAIRKQKSAPYSLYLKVGRQYDDNVSLGQLDEEEHSDEADWLTVGYFSGRYNFVQRKTCQVGLGYSHYQTWYDDMNQYDMTGSIFTLYAKYRIRPFTFGFSYLPSFYWVDSDSYLKRHQFMPEIIWEVNEQTVTRLSYSYYDDDYPDDESRSGKSHELFLDIFYILPGNRASLYGGLGYEDNAADASEYAYAQIKSKLGFSLKMPWKLNLDMTGKYYHKEYDSGGEKDADKYSGAISLSRPVFYEWLELTAEFDCTKNDSDINDYKRKTATMSVTARY
jgi:tetratricopeptide (TPR) repeat protein